MRNFERLYKTNTFSFARERIVLDNVNKLLKANIMAEMSQGTLNVTPTNTILQFLIIFILEN